MIIAPLLFINPHELSFLMAATPSLKGAIKSSASFVWAKAKTGINNSVISAFLMIEYFIIIIF